MTPDDTRKDPGVAETVVQAQAFRTLTEAINPYAQLQNVHPYWEQVQQNLGMTTQVLPGVAGTQSFNAAALTTSMPEFYTSMHRQ